MTKVSGTQHILWVHLGRLTKLMHLARSKHQIAPASEIVLLSCLTKLNLGSCALPEQISAGMERTCHQQLIPETLMRLKALLR